MKKMESTVPYFIVQNILVIRIQIGSNFYLAQGSGSRSGKNRTEADSLSFHLPVTGKMALSLSGDYTYISRLILLCVLQYTEVLPGLLRVPPTSCPADPDLSGESPRLAESPALQLTSSP
jgi:hypothetical protein